MIGEVIGAQNWAVVDLDMNPSSLMACFQASAETKCFVKMSAAIRWVWQSSM